MHCGLPVRVQPWHETGCARAVGCCPFVSRDIDVRIRSMTRQWNDVGYGRRRHINVVTRSRFDGYTPSTTRRRMWLSTSYQRHDGVNCRRSYYIATYNYTNSNRHRTASCTRWVITNFVIKFVWYL